MVRLVFLCVHNSCRSQMAEGFARAWGGGGWEVHSAGSQPAESVDPGAVEAMRHVGIDISGQRPKGLADVPQPVDWVVRMGCGDVCPWLPARGSLDWDIPDPRGGPPELYRRVRDEIARRVRDLIARVAGA